MKKLFLLFLVFVCSLVHAQDLGSSMRPMKYTKRTEPILRGMIVYYGDYYTESDLVRVQNLLEKRFHEATNEMVKLQTIKKKIMPFKHQIVNYPNYRQDNVKDPERLQRLWYYDNVGAAVIKEVYDQLKKELKNIDVLLIITGAQFDGLGFASGRVAVTENPMEIAWGLPNGGRVDFRSDANVVDELIHELGHTMFLDHAASHCQSPDLSYEQKLACCEKSPAKNDVMSYCRNRNQVNDEFFFKFEECNIGIIKNKVIPAMLKGGAWNVANRPKCR